MTGVFDFIALHAHLVTADDGLETVGLAEALGDIRAELETDATLGRSATGHGLGVGPKHLHHETLLARLSLRVPVELADVVE